MPDVKIIVKSAELSQEQKIKSPFVTVSFKGSSKDTKTLKGVSPAWNQTLVFSLSTTPSASEQIKFEVYDDDGFLGIDKFLGRATCTYNALKLSKEKSLNLRNKKDAVIPGCSIVVGMPEEKPDEGEKKDTKRRGSTFGLFGKNKEEGAGDDGDGDGENVDEGVGDEVLSQSGDAPASTSGGVKRTDRSSLSQKVEDFQIRLKVICGRQLTGSNIKPVVKVKVGKTQAKITRIRKGSAPQWNEMLMFNFNESLRELYDYVFEFSVNNSRRLRSDALIGSFKFDVGSIYDQPGHAFVRKWLLLTDPDDPSNSPKGYLKITVCVLGAGDQPPDEKSGKDNDDDDVEGNLLTPAGASLRAANFTLRIYGAEDLPQMDSATLKGMKQKLLGGNEDFTKTLVDPFLTFTFAGKKRKTKIIKETNHPDWNEELNMPLKFPSMCDSIKLTIKDWDRVGCDDPIGTVIIPLSRISSTGEEANGAGFPPTFGPSFVNFYGSPREFSEIRDSLEDLNIGKGEGCAYRGRAMVELVTTMDEEGVEPPPPTQPIADEQVAIVQKYMRRRRYRLVVGFESASMIRKPMERVEFEVSMGNYGNKFDSDVGASSSTTEPGNAVFDGVQYHYMAWTSKKPILMVTSQWEDISFRLYAMNLILRTCDRMETQINRLKLLIKQDADEIEIASEIVSILDMLIMETSKKLPDPRGRTASNQLDRRIHRQRVQTFITICQEAKHLRQNCTDAQEAIAAINDFLERLNLVSYEPQNSFPDVVIWMISDNERVAYARIPAYEILYASEKPEFCGRYCSKPHTITLKYPTANVKSKKHYKVPGQLRIIAWLGRAADQENFEFHSRGQISVYADTFETETKIPVRGWGPDGYTDITGDIPLEKSAFSCPPGWEWDGDWKINSELALLYDTSQGHMHVLEDAFEFQYRFPAGAWEPEKMTNGKNEDIPQLSSITVPEGWEWESEWTVDTNRACDEDGWEYSAPDDDTAGEIAWGTIEKTYHTSRRRRLVRNRVCIDQKVFKKAEKTEELLGEGWEYATTMSSQFHIMPKMLDLVRRRRWVRKMITSDIRGSAAIFNLDVSIVRVDTSKLGKEPITPAQAPPSPTGLEPSGSPTETDATSVQDDDETVDGKSEAGGSQEADGEGKTEGEGEKTPEKLKKKKSKKKKITFDLSLKSDPEKKKSKKKIPKMPSPKIYIVYEDLSKLHLRAYIYQGRDLLPMDQDSFSDPVAMVSFLNQTRRTEVYKHSLNPIWDQTLMVDIMFYGDLEHLQRNCPDVAVEVFDRDDVIVRSLFAPSTTSSKLKTDRTKRPVNGSLEFMGRTSGKPLLKFDPEEDQIPKLQWYSVKKANQAGGSVLAAFELILKHDQRKMPLPPPCKTDVQVPMVPFGIRPVLQRTALEFLIWGVRKMESFNLLSVDSPSVLIQIGEVEIRTKIIKSLKKNPNFSDPIYYIEANLPVDDLYFPPIVIRVKDNRKFGRRPTVGQHIITNSLNYRIKPGAEEPPPDEGYEETDAATSDIAIEIDPPSPGGFQLDFLSDLTGSKPKKAVIVPGITGSGGSSKTSDTEGRSIQLDIIQEEEERQPLLLFHEHTKVRYTSGDDSVQIIVDSDEESTSEFSETLSSESEEGPGDKVKSFALSLRTLRDVIISKFRKRQDEKKIREDEIDWWSKYYASIGETGMYGNYEESGLDLIKVYKNELEKQENFNHFSDFIQTFRLFRGKVEDEDEEPEFAGEFKGTFRIYTVPEDTKEVRPPRFFQNIPPTDAVEVKVRIYVVRASELAPQDSNGLADPYLKIKVGKKRILDRENYIPNTLDPTFGRMFELDLKLPMEKDLYVEVFDWDLIGTDDKIGETIIDLENRYLSKFKAWCALPETYCISGPCPWRDQMKPKEWLEQKCREQKWDEPVWNSNTCVMVAGKTYKLDDYEKDMKPCEHLGPADERLALHILRTFPHVPEHVETRPLFYDVLPNIEQGRLQMWVDMFPKEFGDPGLPYNIEPRKPSKYFLRMVVWNCSEIPMMDVSMLGDQMSDIYFKGWLSGLEHKRQKTDVHYRSLDGTGNFNWRFVFPFDYLPQERMVHVAKKEHLWSLDKTVTKFPPVLNIQVWDNDLIGANEYISEIVLPITNMPKCCKFQRFCTLENVPDMQGNCKNEMLNLFDQKMALKGWWPLYRVVDGVREQAGKLEMSVEILSAEEEEAKPAGQGRDEPNMNPKLEKPNRPATSFAWFSSPFKSLRYIIWRKYKWVILGVLGVLLLVAFIVLFFYSFPQIFSEEVGKLFFPVQQPTA
uniref:myoferlin isoform X3 n=1 Tax=Ciona intestinalis TaxID=7719 RepID=UPI000EF44AD7|nr:myoferlin isoform X3 [Ciona intestinalis]|eukprot:XP_026691585.1 myoferlin isoform X3 [Ciona intestinalis]